jgi:RluA family pseudouridine synthase
MKSSPTVLFQNDTILAMDKPSGLLSVPDRYIESKPSLAGWVLHSFPAARPLHRLDFETSGIVLFCILPEAFGWYSDQFDQRTLSKKYTAITEGRMMADQGIIDEPLFTQSTGKVILSKRGKSSQTQWNLLERFQHHSLIEAHPLTGRTHQIRVHLADMGFPVLGDDVYGYHANRVNLERQPERTLLHAYRLSLKHPITGEALSFHADPPSDFQYLFPEWEEKTKRLEPNW